MQRERCSHRLPFNGIWRAGYANQARLWYPKVLRGEQVWAEKNKVRRGLAMRALARRERGSELMKWRRSATSRCPDAGATNEPQRRDERQPDSFVLIRDIQGKWRLFP